MAINVTCPGCLKRFSVADAHAGKQGPCPSCKELITIPKPEDDVVIHAPKDGPVDSKGRSVLKTAKAKDAKFNPLVAAGVGGVVLLVFVAAFVLSGSEAAQSMVTLGGGAVLLGPLLAWGGYTFLRDSELEPYSGGELAIRSLACGLAFAAGWGVYTYIAYHLGGSWPIESLHMGVMFGCAAAAIGLGAFASYVSLDLDPAVGGVHCALYFVVTVLLRIVLALPALPGLGG